MFIAKETSYDVYNWSVIKFIYKVLSQIPNKRREY